ncbi:MAG: restriction endonuclease [Bacteroidota bacterium]|nr:restriction endonuclease [Bacteroidota bacterium]
MEHTFTATIKSVLGKHFKSHAEEIFEKSLLVQYINEKTRSAGKGSKARSSFANLYAIYVVVEDYLIKGFDTKLDYSRYEGAEFSNLFTRQRELPFGSKLQTHALNNRLNAEFQKYFPNAEYIPIIRNLETNRYWINENLLKINVGKTSFSIAATVIEIIDEYMRTKQGAFDRFVATCSELQQIGNESTEKVQDFISSLLAPDVDARLFEIVSYSILKYYYHDQEIFWGFDRTKLTQESLKLYKTGRTNANDGGIDFVMRPLGRFFQVTESLDFKKYFLDIDKIKKYPITFVIKSEDSIDQLKNRIQDNANKTYSIKTVVEKYMSCIEEVINIPELNDRFGEAVKQGYLNHILDEIVVQSKVEFNYQERR